MHLNKLIRSRTQTEVVWTCRAPQQEQHSSSVSTFVPASVIGMGFASIMFAQISERGIATQYEEIYRASTMCWAKNYDLQHPLPLRK